MPANRSDWANREADLLEMEEWRHLLEELKEQEMGATEAGSISNPTFRNEIIVYRTNFLDEVIAYCDDEQFK